MRLIPFIAFKVSRIVGELYFNNVEVLYQTNSGDLLLRFPSALSDGVIPTDENLNEIHELLAGRPIMRSDETVFEPI